MKILPMTLTMIACQANAGIIAHWTFDETSGDIAHDSAGNFDGTLSGGARFVSRGISGNALSLGQGSNSLVNTGTSFPGFTNGNFSVVAWVKTTTTENESFVLSKHEAGTLNGYLLMVNTSPTYGRPDKAYFYGSTLGGGEAISGATVNDGNWHQIVGVYTSGGRIEIYVDGGASGDAKASQPIQANSAPFLIGGINRSGMPKGSFTGLVDDVQVYDHALSSIEVQYLFEHPGQVVPELSPATEVSEPRISLELYAGLSIEGTVGAKYQITYLVDLGDPNWITLTNLVLPRSPYLFFDATSSRTQHRFYRAVQIR
jgi:concanavalin A-like lectin/glucanase superfamily protein